MSKIILCWEQTESITKKENKKMNNCIFPIIGSSWGLLYLLKLKIHKNQPLIILMTSIPLVDRS